MPPIKDYLPFLPGESPDNETATSYAEIRDVAFLPKEEQKKLSALRFMHNLEGEKQPSFFRQLADKISYFWVVLFSPKKKVLELAQQGASQQMIDKRYPHLHPLIHREAAVAYLKVILDHHPLPEKLPDLIAAAKRELNRQYPGFRGEFSDSFILHEIEKQFSSLQSEKVKRSYTTFCLAEEILNGQILTHIDTLLRLGPEHKEQVDQQIEWIFDAFTYLDVASKSSYGAKMMFSVMHKLTAYPAAFTEAKGKLSPSFQMKLKAEIETAKVKELLLNGAYDTLKSMYRQSSSSDKEHLQSLVTRISQDASSEMKLKIRALGALVDMADIRLEQSRIHEHTYTSDKTIPGLQKTVAHEAIDYPNSIDSKQCAIDYGRSPYIFVDNELYSRPVFQEMYPIIQKKYGDLAAKMITQGKFGAAQFCLFDELNPRFFSEGVSNLMSVTGNDLMVYIVENKNDRLQFTLKICYKIMQQENEESDPAFCYYVPAEQTLSIPLSELKQEKIDETKVQTSIQIHASVATLKEACKTLNMPIISTQNVPKMIADYKKMTPEKRKVFIDDIALLLVERGLSAGEDMEKETLPHMAQVLQAIVDKTKNQKKIEKALQNSVPGTSLYQTLEKDLKDALLIKELYQSLLEKVNSLISPYSIDQ